MRAYGYARLSRDDDKSVSIASQERAIRRWCEAHDATLVDVFTDEDLSAWKRGVRRPGFDRLMSSLGECDVVITRDLSRLARSVVGFANLQEQFEAAGVQIATTNGTIDTTTANGRAVLQLTTVFAELEAATTSERVKAIVQYKKDHGLWIGQVPWGWRVATADDADEDRTRDGLVQVPEEQAEIEAIVRRYVGGESLRSISRTTRHTHANLARVLRTDRVLEALPPDLASRLVIEMGERGRTGTTATPSLLGGVARCAVCDGPLTVVATRMRSGKPWAAYGCKERGHVTISKPFLDQHVSDSVLDAISVPRLVERMEKHRHQTATTMAPAAIEARIEALEIARFEEGTIGHTSYLKRRSALFERLAAARAAAEADAGPDLPLELARQLPARWPDLTVGEKRRVVRALVREVRVSRATGTGKIDPSRAEIAWRW